MAVICQGHRSSGGFCRLIHRFLEAEARFDLVLRGRSRILYLYLLLADSSVYLSPRLSLCGGVRFFLEVWVRLYLL